MAAHGHAKSDLRNLQLHRVVVQKLGETPALRAPCLALAERWLASPEQSSSRPWLHQWVEMLRDWPTEEIARIVLDPDGGQTLRQCVNPKKTRTVCPRKSLNATVRAS